jgi:hypothetical protein
MAQCEPALWYHARLVHVVMDRILVKSNFFLYHAATTLLFYIIKRMTTPVLFMIKKICYHTSLYDPVVSGTSVDSTS